MTRVRSSRRRTGWLAIAGLAVAFALVPGSAAAMSGSASHANLSPRLAELAEDPLRSSSSARQATALSLAPRGPGSLLREGRRVLVGVRFDHGTVAGLEGLRAAGAKVLDVSRRYQTVSVAARPGDLHAIGAVPGVGGVTALLAPIARGADCGGSIRSEGDIQLNAAGARPAFGVDGSGVTVGILSDSFDRNGGAATRAAGDVASGDLPGPGSPCGSESPVGVLDDSAGGRDEGRAMAQIVHDLAPGASFAFATAFTPDLFGFATNIRRLADAGAQVIVDDVFFAEEPFFQDGPVAVAVNEVTGRGATHFSAAGNDNLMEEGTGNEIGSWEAPEYRDSGGCPPAIVALSEELEELEKEIIEEEELEAEPEGLHPSHCMNFDPEGGDDETFGITVAEGGVLNLDLQWAEPWFGVNTDLDAFLLDKAGNLLKAEGFPVFSAEDNVNGTQQPVEFFQWANPVPEQEVQLVVNRFSGEADPRLKFVLLENGFGVTATEYPESKGEDVVGPTIFGHSGARGAISVGAVPFDQSSAPEPYSSRGPLTHYFGPVSGTSPAKPIVPQTISKPDIGATDCGATTFFARFVGNEGVWRFCGTSAAAPHAAAVAALMKQANPSLSPAQLRGALAATARPVGVFGPEAVGAGLINAFGAVSSVALPPTISITEAPPALGRNRRPIVRFAANRPVGFSCSLDGGGLQSCTSPFLPPAPLTDGVHGFAVRGIDVAGRVGTSETVSFRIDTRRPRTFFRRHPRKAIRTRSRRAKATFRFGSNERDATFVCKVDGGFQRFCNPRLTRRFQVGRHVVWVKARDAAGNVDRTAAVYRFRVKRIG